MNKHHGFGLPEVMISLLLASLIITALMNHYIRVKRHYLHLQSIMDETMDVQLVTDLMRDSIRQAGFTPCMSLKYLTTRDRRDGHANLSAIDVGSELNIYRMSPYFNRILSGENSARIRVTRNYVVREDRPLIIADCYHAEVHRVVSVVDTVDGQIVTLSNALEFIYQQPVYAGEWLHERFFTRPDGGLFYEGVTTDELTSFVKTLSLKLDANLVSIQLGLKHQQSLILETRVRA